jgi:hypothetical protein
MEHTCPAEPIVSRLAFERRKHWRSSVEVVEMIEVLSECGPSFELGWEAGIRTQIPWSRSGEWIAVCAGPLCFAPVFGVSASVGSLPFGYVHVENVSMCLRPCRFRRVAPGCVEQRVRLQSD